MNREILFRGKRIDNGEWVEGDLSHRDWLSLTKANNGIQQYIYPYNDVISLELSYEVIPSTVGQFTGLTDKNGKRVFEGDKVEWMDCVFVIMWDDDNCCFYGKRYPNNELRGDLSAMSFPNSTVIGTIHD